MAVARNWCVAIAIASAACPRGARASPVDDPTSGRAVFTGATMPVASSIVLDPAALATPGPLNLPQVDEVYVGLTSTVDQIGIARRTIDLDTGALSPGGSVHDITLSPGADLAYLWHPSQGFAFGVQLRMPPGQTFPELHDELRYHTLGGYQRDVQSSLALSVRVAGGIYFGAGVTVDATLLRLRFARDTALEQGHGPGGLDSDCGGARCGVENPIATETYDIKVQERSPLSDGYIVNLGGMIQLMRDVWLALSYHTPPGGATSVQNTLSGSSRVTRAPRDGGNVIEGGATVYISQPASVDVEVRARVAPLLELHVGGRWLDLSRESGYDVRMYGSVFPGANVPEWTEQPRDFHDTFALWGGVEQVDTGQRWRFGGRFGLETSATDDRATTPLTIAPHSATFDVGAQLRVTPSFIIQFGYGLQVFPGVDVKDSAFDPRDRVSCVDGGFDYASPACAAVRNGYAIPTAAGDYSRIEHAIRIGFKYERL